MFTIVLVNPQIPPNTGSTGRLCAAVNAKLHVVGKLGFELSDKTLKRAGLDYWDQIDWKYFPDKKKYFSELESSENFHLLTTKSPNSYFQRTFNKGDYLVFGSETKGLDENYLRLHWEKTCKIPMENPNIRSLNLATSVGIVLFEALRQNNV